jgi:hypothetical protein
MGPLGYVGEQEKVSKRILCETTFQRVFHRMDKPALSTITVLLLTTHYRINHGINPDFLSTYPYSYEALPGMKKGLD